MVIIILHMVKNAFDNHLTIEQFEFENFPIEIKEFTIFFISDIHRRTIDDKLLNKVRGKADIVIIGGDLTERNVPYTRISENLAKLTDIAPTYFVWGNNDYEVDEDCLQELFLLHGVCELKNDIAFLANEKIVLIGTDDLSQELPPLEWLIDIKQDQAFRILISHTPDLIENLPENHQISLALSGHNHGGQIRIFGFGIRPLGGVIYTKGLTLFVSNGYGTSVVPLRLGVKAEAHLIILKNK